MTGFAMDSKNQDQKNWILEEFIDAYKRDDFEQAFQICLAGANHGSAEAQVYCGEFYKNSVRH